jgi:D-sedoheptulose 7-phosphate isomerase
VDQTAISVFQQQYFDNFRQALEGIAATRNNEAIPYDAALEVALGWLLDLQARKGRIFVIGNGGSAGVASHLAVDFWKNGKISAMAFNDGSLLTCLANDLAFEEVFAASIRQFGQQGDLAICISSSGNSENIVRGALAARDLGATVITCSGFDPGNRLRTLGDLNFYVPSHSYGIVETLHQLIIHSLLDVKLHLKDGMDVFYKNRV